MLDDKFTDFFRGNNGKWSMVRLGFIVSVVGGLALCFVHPEQSTQGASIIVAAFGSKFFSKPFEGK